MEKKELEVRLSLLDEEQLERLIWAEPEKWGIKKEHLAMCEGWADVLEVEKVSDTEFQSVLTLTPTVMLWMCHRLSHLTIGLMRMM